MILVCQRGVSQALKGVPNVCVSALGFPKPFGYSGECRINSGFEE